MEKTKLVLSRQSSKRGIRNTLIPTTLWILLSFSFGNLKNVLIPSITKIQINIYIYMYINNIFNPSNPGVVSLALTCQEQQALYCPHVSVVETQRSSGELWSETGHLNVCFESR